MRQPHSTASSASYIPLRTHTLYSLLEGAIRIPELLDRVETLGLPAVGIADTAHLFGAPEFSFACQKRGIQPILGCQLWLVEEDAPDNPYPFVVYIQNREGYQNLCALITASTQPPRTGRLDFALVSQHHEGLLAITGGPKGLLSRYLEHSHPDKALKALKAWQQVFGDRLYVELSRYDTRPETLDKESLLVDWAYDLGIPLLATNEAFFMSPASFEAQDALGCVAQGRYVQEENRPRLTENHYFRSPREMAILFEDLPEALENTQHLQKRCGFLLETMPPRLPSFPGVVSEIETLNAECRKGLESRLVHEVFPRFPEEEHSAIRTQYEARLHYECDVIVSMDFSGYFLIVSDFIRWAKGQDIPVGPGRGSGAGSLVAWSLDITDLDPIRFSLLFERFLNPERVSMPDFDVDFCQERRDEVIAYVAQKYGADRVAHIITFGSLQPRAVLRDVGRVLHMPYGQVDRLCKLIPNHPSHPITLSEAILKEPQLSVLAKEDETVQKLLDIGKQLEGLYRHASTHAAGLIIGDQPLTQILPLYQEEGSALPATEFSMKYVESVGLVKFDFLGLKTLTVLHQACSLLRDRGIEIDLKKIPLDDAKTFDLLCRVETAGLFQIESVGMSEVLRQLQPTRFEEIVALISLYRPGPMDDIPRYIACRHQRETVRYAYPCLEEALSETYGVMIYQEQILHIARRLAGYSLGGADLLRRAMGKKIPQEMNAQREIFIQGVLKNFGGKEETATHLFDAIAKFAGYAFPKAHAVGYALISYQTAYMKAHYPVEFMVALLNTDGQNTDKIYYFVREVKRMEISLLPPDINRSFSRFSVEIQDDGVLAIRYGLAALRNIGTAALEKIFVERQANGVFHDIFDIFERVTGGVLTKKLVETLIAAGALDGLHANRGELMASLDTLLQYTQRYVPRENVLFSLRETRPSLNPEGAYDALQQEYKALGFYLSAHPLDAYGQTSGFVWCQEVNRLRLVAQRREICSMLGVVLEVQERLSRQGKKFAILRLSDPTGSYEVTLFRDLLETIRPLLEIGASLALQVQVRLEGDTLRLSAQAIQPIQQWKPAEEADSKKPSDPSQNFLTLYIQNEKELIQLHHVLLKASLGDMRCQIWICVPPYGRVRLRLQETYEVAPFLQKQLQSFLGGIG